MIRLTDEMGIFSAANIINKQRNRNSPGSPRKYSSLLLITLSILRSVTLRWVCHFFFCNVETASQQCS